MIIETSLGECFWVRPRRRSFRRAIELAVRPEEVVEIARRLRRNWETSGASAGSVVAWWLRAEFHARRLRYIPDPEGPFHPDGPLDFWCSPTSTIARRGGDCDDLAVLVASILLAMGLSAQVVVGTHLGQGHAWVEGIDRNGGFMIEATNGDLHRCLPFGYERDL